MIFKLNQVKKMPFYFHFNFGVNGDIFFVFFLRVKEDTRTFVSHYYSKNIVRENSCLFIKRFIAE